MPSATVIPIQLLGTLRELHRSEPTKLDHALPDLGLRPLTGGCNNRVYAWDSPDGPACLKLYRTGKRDRAACEYQALTHVAAHGFIAAPRPLWHDPDPDLPAVAMTLLAGRPMPEIFNPAAALPALVDSLAQLRAIPVGPFDDIPRVGSVRRYLDRIMRVWPRQLDDHDGEPVTSEMRSLLSAWHAHGDAELLAAPAARILSRGDANLLNWLWQEPDIHVVDWEFTGYSDTAYDAAELVEHLSAREIPDTRWADHLGSLGIVDETGRRRFYAARRTVALRWLSVLWKRRLQRAAEFEFQVQRVQNLLLPTNNL